MQTLTINLPDNLDIEEFETKMIFAGQLHAKGKITLGQAADIVGISKRAFMKIMGRFGFSVFNYSVEDLEHDIRIALGNWLKYSKALANKMRIYTSLTAVFFLLIVTSVNESLAQPVQKPLRVGVVGLVHTHVHGIFRKAYKETGQKDIEIVGIAEPNRALAERYAKQYGFPISLVYPTLAEMLDKAKPEAVTDFGRIVDHLQTVKVCAPRGIHVMVEKPLSISFEQAKQMEALVKQHSIQLLTNYETTWYGSNHKAYALANNEKAIGDLRKIVVHDGHQGPKEIGVTPEFLDWLTDPATNGAGALFDFGCYGANLSTWLLGNQRPTSVRAVTQQIKPDVYPKVDDEATIVLTYPKTQTIIQASWNWPFSRKDMEVYGQTGYVHTIDGTRMRIRLKDDKTERTDNAMPADAPATDPFAYLARLLRKETKPDALTSLENNMIVMEILDAARQSAKTGKVVSLK